MNSRLTFMDLQSLEADREAALERLADENGALRARLRGVAHSPLSDSEKRQLLLAPAPRRMHSSAPASIALAHNVSCIDWHSISGKRELLPASAPWRMHLFAPASITFAHNFLYWLTLRQQEAATVAYTLTVAHALVLARLYRTWAQSNLYWVSLRQREASIVAYHRASSRALFAVESLIVLAYNVKCTDLLSDSQK